MTETGPCVALPRKTQTNNNNKIRLCKKPQFRFDLNCGDCANASPPCTNYDVGSTTWVDLRQAPLLSAMEVTNLGHGPS